MIELLRLLFKRQVSLDSTQTSNLRMNPIGLTEKKAFLSLQQDHRSTANVFWGPRKAKTCSSTMNYTFKQVEVYICLYFMNSVHVLIFLCS